MIYYLSMNKLEGFLTTQQAADKAGISRQGLYFWINKGWLLTHRIGSTVLIHIDDLEKAKAKADKNREGKRIYGKRRSELAKE